MTIETKSDLHDAFFLGGLIAGGFSLLLDNCTPIIFYGLWLYYTIHEDDLMKLYRLKHETKQDNNNE